MATAQTSPAGGAAAPGEVARFDALAAQWWDPRGPMAPLHAMNPLRVGWIAARLQGPGLPGPGLPGLVPPGPVPPGPVRLLDVGCGAGLAAEALARLGHDVLGIDAAGQALEAGRAHAEGRGLPLAYRQATTTDLVREGQRFAAVTALEVIEHVPDPAGFLRDLACLLEPGGRLFVSTLNRTARALLVAKLGAEYVLRLLPVGTHDWRRFITPAELAREARAGGLRMTATAGMSFDPLRRQWRESRDLAVNYIAAFELAAPRE